MKRARLTWAAGRVASASPAIPGYDTEDQDHPAHQPDPAYEEYAKGDPSAWAEDPRKPPYPQGNPPALPGYDVEDQDHPAHKELPRVPKGASLTAMVEAKAAKVMRVARALLGRDASVEVVEKQAFDLMDMPDPLLDATLARMGGNPMMAEDEKPTPSAPVAQDEDLDALLGMDEEELPPVAARRAGQNAPGGSQNSANAPGKDEAAARAEGAATTEKQEAKKAARRFFASMDTDGDGFVTAQDWTGSKAMFTALDTDKDGIVAEDEVVDMLACGESAVADDLDPEEQAMLAEMEAQACGVTAGKKADDDEGEEPTDEAEGKKADKKGDDEEPIDKEACDDAAIFGLTGDPMGLSDEPLPPGEEDALLAAIFGGKVAGKKGDDEEIPDEEFEEPEGGKKGEDEESPVAGKKAGLTRTASQRPQPRKPNPGIKTVGQQVRVASNDIADLSRLWPSDPDVSAVFGTTPRS